MGCWNGRCYWAGSVVNCTQSELIRLNTYVTCLIGVSQIGFGFGSVDSTVLADLNVRAENDGAFANV